MPRKLWKRKSTFRIKFDFKYYKTWNTGIVQCKQVLFYLTKRIRRSKSRKSAQIASFDKNQIHTLLINSDSNWAISWSGLHKGSNPFRLELIDPSPVLDPTPVCTSVLWDLDPGVLCIEPGIQCLQLEEILPICSTSQKWF